MCSTGKPRPSAGKENRPNAMRVPTIIAKPDAGAIARAAECIRAGGLVAFPTETVYGLGADATNGLAVARIFEAKGRPRFNPLIVHVPSLADAERIGIFSKTAKALAQEFWPGPLTLVVKRRADCTIAELVSAGLDTLAIRVPDHAVAQALLKSAGRPIAAPSANRSGHVSATRAEHVAADLAGSVALILDGGATVRGLESTIIDVSGEETVQLRPGAVAANLIEAVAGMKIARFAGHSLKPISPGQLESHYATHAPLRLNARSIKSGEALLAFGAHTLKTDASEFNLSLSGDLVEAAANLFAALRELDSRKPAAIAVMPIPETGLGEAINDRLKRAAAPRASS